MFYYYSLFWVTGSKCFPVPTFPVVRVEEIARASAAMKRERKQAAGTSDSGNSGSGSSEAGPSTATEMTIEEKTARLSKYNVLLSLTKP